MEYDHQGRRIRQTVFNDRDDGQGSELSDTIFLYDGWNLVAELNANASNAKVRTYVWGADLSGTMQGAGGVGGLLKVTYYGGSTTNAFAAYDGNGNVMALVDASNGSVCAHYEYGPFAEPIRISGPISKLNPLRFSTKYTDDESGFLYYGYRFYNPSTGRWLSRDPIGELGAVVMMFETKDVDLIKRVLPASPEARRMLLQNRYYGSKLTSLNPTFGFGPRDKDSFVVPLYVLVQNDPILSYDPDGNVAPWLAGCAVGCVWGGIGGATGGMGGGWKGVKCGALGGAVSGCCSGAICASLPNFCIAGSCLCGVLGSIAEQACLGSLNYKDPCVWLTVSGSGIAGCLAGMAEATEEATAKVIAFVVGMDVSALSNFCGK
ncbi:MAG: RHS repeat-associated core domain-containing protein [Verrucomicrobia bacterium]|nr:RHS repeat-associated core domain-containing protein [Verrucomicrobiota bacterium]